MRVVLELIESWLREHSPSTVESLRPRATPRQLDEAAHVLGVHLPPELSSLYRWHDGATATGSPFEVVPTFYFMSLERALDAWSGRNQLYRKDLDRDRGFPGWQPHWLPIGADICGGYIVVETGGDKPGRVFESSFVSVPCPGQGWASLNDWAEDMLGSFTSGRPFRARWRPDSTGPVLVWRA